MWDGHCCLIPLDGDKHWWTCSECGQMWRKVDGTWRLAPTEVAT
jgi:hypothetical protein